MSQKLENILNLALETPEGIREETENLNVGYDNGKRTWELIVKYHGSLDSLAALGVKAEPLILGYAILTVPEDLVDTIAALDEIEYVEKPKRFYYSDLTACAGQEFGAESCILPVTLRDPYLTGQGVLIAVLDSGIDYGRKEFRSPDGTTRILFLWDQALDREFDSAQINEALTAAPGEAAALVPSRDRNGHGTAVAGIAAGSGPGYEGAAPGVSLLIVKLGTPSSAGGTSDGAAAGSLVKTTQIMRGVTYALRKAQELSMPLVINLSFGNNYGSHDGTSLLERFLDNASEIGQTVICAGSGNEGNSSGHAAGNVADRPVTELAVADYERSLSIQLWKHYADRYRISLRSPGGVIRQLPDTLSSGKYTMRMEQTDLLIYFGEPTPYSADQEIYFEMIPAAGPYLNSGLWQIRLEPVETVTGQYYLYLPGSEARNQGTGFTGPSPEATLTIPSTAARVLTVGAYDSARNSYADFSGRGYGNEMRPAGAVSAQPVKPDVAAPGVDVLAPDLYGGFQPMTGTSFAAPIVSGCAALLMEWGIRKGNDPFLYGEKLKAYLRKGARPIRGEDAYPNAKTGFGALCLKDSFPG